MTSQLNQLLSGYNQRLNAETRKVDAKQQEEDEKKREREGIEVPIGIELMNAGLQSGRIGSLFKKHVLRHVLSKAIPAEFIKKHGIDGLLDAHEKGGMKGALAYAASKAPIDLSKLHDMVGGEDNYNAIRGILQSGGSKEDVTKFLGDAVEKAARNHAAKAVDTARAAKSAVEGAATGAARAATTAVTGVVDRTNTIINNTTAAAGDAANLAQQKADELKAGIQKSKAAIQSETQKKVADVKDKYTKAREKIIADAKAKQQQIGAAVGESAESIKAKQAAHAATVKAQIKTIKEEAVKARKQVIDRANEGGAAARRVVTEGGVAATKMTDARRKEITDARDAKIAKIKARVAEVETKAKTTQEKFAANVESRTSGAREDLTGNTEARQQAEAAAAAPPPAAAAPPPAPKPVAAPKQPVAAEPVAAEPVPAEPVAPKTLSSVNEDGEAVRLPGIGQAPPKRRTRAVAAGAATTMRAGGDSKSLSDASWKSLENRGLPRIGNEAPGGARLSSVRPSEASIEPVEAPPPLFSNPQKYQDWYKANSQGFKAVNDRIQATPRRSDEGGSIAAPDQRIAVPSSNHSTVVPVKPKVEAPVPIQTLQKTNVSKVAPAPVTRDPALEATRTSAAARTGKLGPAAARAWRDAKFAEIRNAPAPAPPVRRVAPAPTSSPPVRRVAPEPVQPAREIDASLPDVVEATRTGTSAMRSTRNWTTPTVRATQKVRTAKLAAQGKIPGAPTYRSRESASLAPIGFTDDSATTISRSSLKTSMLRNLNAQGVRRVRASAPDVEGMNLQHQAQQQAFRETATEPLQLTGQGANPALTGGSNAPQFSTSETAFKSVPQELAPIGIPDEIPRFRSAFAEEE